MELANEVARVDSDVVADRAAVQEALVSATLIISPIAPHIAHRLWSELGQQGDLVNQLAADRSGRINPTTAVAGGAG